MKIFLPLCLLLVMVPSMVGAQGDWPKAAAELQLEAQSIREDAQKAFEDMTTQEAELQAEVNRLRAETGHKEASLSALKQRFEALLDQEAQARSALADREQDLALIESAVLNAARDAERLYLTSPSALLARQRLQECRALLDDEGLPGFGQIQNLIRGLFGEIEDSGQTTVVQAPFLGPTGDEVQGKVLRLGNNAVYCIQDDEPKGLILLDGGRFSTGNAVLPDPVAEAVSALFQHPDDFAPLPLDLSGGTVLKTGGDAAGPWTHIRSGGVLVWPILTLGLIGLLLSLERLWVLIQIKVSSSSVLEHLADLMRQGDRDGCRRVCRQYGDSPACRVLGASLDHAGAPKEVLENVFHDAILKEVPRLERFLPTLSVLGATAPLLGLLGTVTGMINTFSVMTLSGNSDPKLMSGGISEALVTTELGLAVAIPILLLHHFLERRVDSIVADMEERSVAFSVTLLDTRASRKHKVQAT